MTAHKTESPHHNSDLTFFKPTDGQRIRHLMSWAGLADAQAARELGVDEATLRAWCAREERVKPPRMAILALERLVQLQRKIDIGP